MAFELKITHLCVGQGLSVLIELSYGAPVRRFVGLLDLGSSSGGPNFYGGAINKIIDAVHANNHTLNYVHISHFDDDHYNKFQTLRLEYDIKHGSSITIGNLIYGRFGNLTAEKIRLRKTCFNGFTIPNPPATLDDAKKYVRGNPYPASAGRHARNVNILLEGAYYFRINTLLYRAHLFSACNPVGDSVVINTGSSIILVTVTYWDAPLFSFLSTGDATIHTYKFLNEKCRLEFRDENKLITLAHHGTKLHVADDDDTYTTLNTFLNYFDANAAVVSAKSKKNWTHPHADTIANYETKVVDAAAAHDLTTFYKDGVVVKLRPVVSSKKIYATSNMPGAIDGAAYNPDTAIYEKFDVVAVFDSANIHTFDINPILRP